MHSILIVTGHWLSQIDWESVSQRAGIVCVCTPGPLAGLELASEGGWDAIFAECPLELLPAFTKQLQSLPDPPPLALCSHDPAAPILTTKVGANVFIPLPCSQKLMQRHICKLARIPLWKNALYIADSPWEELSC